MTESNRTQMTCNDPIEIVSEFPHSPTAGAAYSLAGAKREDVIHGTHVAHKYPAKFIPQIPRWALKRIDSRPATVLDPFCGSGTTSVEAGRLGFRALGCDISPLAVLITRAKCSILTSNDVSSWEKLSHQIVEIANQESQLLTDELKEAIGRDVHGLHYTWSNWFEPEGAAQLVALRRAIEQTVSNQMVRDCALTSLSSIIKSCSYLNEDQIKVRYDAGKKIAAPFISFPKAAASFFEKQLKLSHEYKNAEASFDVQEASALSLPFETESVDAVITSPPYINAVDYTMAHKYNLFVLGLLSPPNFKDHCRDYIGVTERAVRAADISSRPQCKIAEVSPWIDALDGQKTPTATNRAFVVTQYFNGMYDSFVEAFRVMKEGGTYTMIVGESNRICGLTIPTADLIEACAITAGFTVKEKFLHALANRSAMRLTRSATGGEIPFERVLVFCR
ncbi:DNA methyltransferase [Pseudomonas siliginis]|uniref:DNA methyltransferase n=1 Tax=Pseudomonas siliginis TaxID=2842346 RepID=UPI002094005A|nr:DNA methyltransferase [Pseudomonas siliginis]USU01354.1 hypothetical protein NF680_03520 [Pseudomonas siliginis]